MSFGFDHLARDYERGPRFTFWDKNGCVVAHGVVLSPDGYGISDDERDALAGLSMLGTAAILEELGLRAGETVGGCYAFSGGRLRLVQS